MKNKNSFIKNIIGRLLMYGSCDCGKSFWYADIDNPGIMTSMQGGNIICNDCYEENKEEIDKNNKKFYGR